MQVWIVGQGQLATELLKGLRVDGTVAAWPGADCARGQPSVVVHAGSGRELDAVVAYCRASQSPSSIFWFSASTTWRKARSPARCASRTTSRSIAPA